MRTAEEIEDLLPQLDTCIADDLEDQDLDFKKWDDQSMDESVKLVVRMAICMANGGGGTVVFGVMDHISGRNNAILGVPPEKELMRENKSIRPPGRGKHAVYCYTSESDT